MKRIKIYTSEKTILDKIDAARGQAKELNRNAETYEATSRQMLITSGVLRSKAKTADQLREANSMRGQADELKELAVKARKQAKRIEEVKLPALGEALSAIRTDTMLPVMGDYKGVASTA